MASKETPEEMIARIYAEGTIAGMQRFLRELDETQEEKQDDETL